MKKKVRKKFHASDCIITPFPDEMPPFVRQCGIIEIYQRKSLTKGGIFTPRGKPNNRYSGEFKQRVVETMQKEHLGYREAVRQFEISDHKLVAKWERIYLEEGVGGLYIDRRGRKSTGQSPKLDKKQRKI